MQKQNDWSTENAAQSSILALLYEDTYRYSSDIEYDLNYLIPLYMATKAKILAEVTFDAEATTKLLGLLHIVIAEMLFKHIGIQLLEGNFAKMIDTMYTITSRLDANAETVKKVTNYPSVVIQDNVMYLLIHLNSRLLYNIALLTKSNLTHTMSLACDRYIQQWSNGTYINDILGTSNITFTIAKNVVRLITPEQRTLIQTKASLTVDNRFPKLYHYPKETENILTLIINSSAKSELTLDKRLYIQYQELFGAKAKTFYYDLRPAKVECKIEDDPDYKLWFGIK